MRAFIFAAGLGTRLKPLTDTMPKALVPVCGQPLIHHVVERLKSFGFNEFVVNVHHFSDQIVDYLRQYPDPSLRFLISDESDLLRETGGGIRHAAGLFDGKTEEPFLVHNVDILSDIDLGAFYRSYHPGTLATLMVSSRETQRYLLFRRVEGRLRLSGWMNKVTGQVRSSDASLRREASEGFDYQEFLCKHSLEMYAFSGIHLISPRIFALMASWPEKFSIIDFYLAMASEYEINAFVTEGKTIVDVGKLNTLSVAEKFVDR